MVALAADCVPIAVARDGGRPALAVLHAGWRGLAEGVVAAGVAPLGDGPKAAVVGPPARPLLLPGRPRGLGHFDPDLSRGRILDLWSAAERALLRAGVARVDRDRPLHCAAAASCSSPTAATARCTGRQGVLGAVTG